VSNVTPFDIHARSIVIDAVCPLVRDDPQYIEWYRAGGVTAIAPTVGSVENARVTLNRLAAWHRMLREREDLLLVRRAQDVEAAKQSGRMGIYFHFQGTDPIEDNLDLIDVYKALGVLSSFGIKLIERLNAARVIVDCSHTGLRTAMDAVECSSAPVILSHSNSAAVHVTARNVPNELIDAIARSGGVIGVAGFPAMVGSKPRPSLEDFARHVEAIVHRVGVDHVGLGIDYYIGQAGVASDEDAVRKYQAMVRAGVWGSAYPPPPHHYPAGIETPKTLPHLTAHLLQCGYGETDVQKILGGNWLRIMRGVWG
jgi:membrane dipeptidase